MPRAALSPHRLAIRLLSRHALRLGGGLALLASCGAPGVDPEELPDAVQGAPIQIPRGEPYTEIARLEDERRAGDGRLASFLSAPDPAVRIRAALALGRFVHPTGGAEPTRSLCRALEDPDPNVRAAVALALGSRGDSAGAGCLLNHWNDPEPVVRAALVRAATHLDHPEVRREVVRALRDPVRQVRIEAAQATALWSRDSTDAGTIDSALLALLGPSAAAGGGTLASDELTWRVLYALGRRRAEKGRAIYVQHLKASDPLVRLFAVRALGRIPPSPKAVPALAAALDDSDWRVACEAATALGVQVGDPAAAEALVDAVEHPSHHVRQAAVGSLGRVGIDTRAVRSLLWRGARDLSASVRADAIDALARILPNGEALSAIDEHRNDRDPWVRQGAARGAVHLDTERAVPILTQLVRDDDRRVAAVALEGLGNHPTEEVRGVLTETLAHPDNGLVLAALLALRSSGTVADVPLLAEALERQGDIANEIAAEAVVSLGEIGGRLARRVVEGALAHPNRFVRQTASRTLVDAFGARATSAAPAGDGALAASPSPIPAPFRGTTNPIVQIETTRGPLVFELFPAEAPIHVHNFLELAREGHYDGLIFHRVVPDFVVQGGDYRGDGNGGTSWRGGPLRNEFGPRKYARGSLGMPRHADPDSGGSQLFVTHRPTPHLDGRYTLFGQLRLGESVLDALQVGDRILSVTRLPAPNGG